MESEQKKKVSRVPTTQSTSNLWTHGWFTSATLLAHDSISHTVFLFCLQIYHIQSYTGQSALFLQCSSLVTWPTPLHHCPQSDLKVPAAEDPIWGISLKPTQSIPTHLYWFYHNSHTGHYLLPVLTFLSPVLALRNGKPRNRSLVSSAHHYLSRAQIAPGPL